MHSIIAEALKMKFHPAAVIWSDDEPAEALRFQAGKWGCVMSMFAQSASGKTAVFDRDTFGCLGGGTGLGFGDQYLNWPGGIDCFCKFLSTGHEDEAEAQYAAENIVGGRRKSFAENLLYGEGYIKTPELAEKFYRALPIIDIPTRYVIFKPLKEVREGEEPKVIVFSVNPDQLSALVVLANYNRETVENVMVPFGAGCQQIALFPYREAESDHPRAVIGLTDLSARVYTRRILGRDVLTFAVPFKMFLELEGNVKGSFLERETWRKLTGNSLFDSQPTIF